MKTRLALLGIGALLLCGGCNGPRAGDEATAKKVAALETKVSTLEARAADLRLKSRIVSSQLFQSPLDRFFAEPEFWENPYDSGAADCANRCSKTLQTEFAACSNNADPPKCRQDALARGSNCQTQCSANHPPPIP